MSIGPRQTDTDTGHEPYAASVCECCGHDPRPLRRYKTNVQVWVEIVAHDEDEAARFAEERAASVQGALDLVSIPYEHVRADRGMGSTKLSLIGYGKVE